MKFSRIIGKVNPKLVLQAEEKLSKVFLELGTRYNNSFVGSGMGGDPLIFSLVYPVEHVCTLNMPTAATDGKRYYWNPKFVLKQSTIGLRIICAHEAWHAIYMHPQRRGSRLPKLWNIAVDYIVNGMVMEDFKTRGMDPDENFSTHLGKYLTLTQYAEMIKNPFKKMEGLEDLDVTPESNPITDKLPSPNEDRDLTEKEIKELERREKKEKFFFADSGLKDDMKRPEAIYDFLYNLLPKCSKCGSIGMYKMPKGKSSKKDKSDKKNKSDQEKQDQSDKSEDKDKSDDHNHGDGEKCDCPDHNKSDQPGDSDQSDSGQSNNSCDHDNCDECGGGVDIFGLGGTLDDHMDTEESQEKLSKRMSDAMEAAKKMAGHVPAGLEDELGTLTAPKVSWKDIIRTRLLKARSGNGRNDWTRFRTRPMFSGLLVPKRKSYFAHFGCLLDTSGSMSKDDIAFGLSQLASLDERSEGTIVPCDCKIYFDKATKIKKCNIEELSKVKVVGRGGTVFAPFFTEYEEHIGKCDFLVIITDGYLLDTDIAEMKNPGIDVIWLVTSKSSFSPPFGRSFDLLND